MILLCTNVAHFHACQCFKEKIQEKVINSRFNSLGLFQHGIKHLAHFLVHVQCHVYGPDWPSDNASLWSRYLKVKELAHSCRFHAMKLCIGWIVLLQDEKQCLFMHINSNVLNLMDVHQSAKTLARKVKMWEEQCVQYVPTWN